MASLLSLLMNLPTFSIALLMQLYLELGVPFLMLLVAAGFLKIMSSLLANGKHIRGFVIFHMICVFLFTALTVAVLVLSIGTEALLAEIYALIPFAVIFVAGLLMYLIARLNTVAPKKKEQPWIVAHRTYVHTLD